MEIIVGLLIGIARFVNAWQDAWNFERGTDNRTWHTFKTVFLSLWAIGFFLLGKGWRNSWRSVATVAVALLLQWLLFEWALPRARRSLKDMKIERRQR